MNDTINKVSLRGAEVYIFGCPDELIDYADAHPAILVAINAEKILNADERTLPIINNNIAYCDGSGAVLAARQKGGRRVRKIAGCELWLHIIRRHCTDRSFYIIGAKPDVHEIVIDKLRREFPGINIVGHRNGYLRGDQERKALIDDVAAKRPDIVFVAMGSPTQELLMADMQRVHPSAIYQGLGGSFDVYSGKVQRAPQWWIDHNSEFIYRLIRQPSRIKREIRKLKFAWWLLLHKF